MFLFISYKIEIFGFTFQKSLSLYIPVKTFSLVLDFYKVLNVILCNICYSQIKRANYDSYIHQFNWCNYFLSQPQFFFHFVISYDTKNKMCEVVELTVNYLEIEGDTSVYSLKLFKTNIYGEYSGILLLLVKLWCIFWNSLNQHTQSYSFNLIRPYLCIFNLLHIFIVFYRSCWPHLTPSRKCIGRGIFVGIRFWCSWSER